MEIACIECRHWNPITSSLGECRRNPPRATPRDLPRGDELAWVLTRAEDWCGECSSSAEASNNEKPVESTNPPHQVSQQDQKRLISERDAAKYIGMSRSYLAKGRMEGALPGRTPPPPFVRIGRAIRYDIADLDSWLEKHKYGL